MATHAASPTCCPVPSYNELVRPCHCHRAQLSAGQPAPAPRTPQPGRAPAARRDLFGSCLQSTLALRGAFAWLSSGVISLFPPTFSGCSCNHCLLHSAEVLSHSCWLLVCSPQSCPSACCLTGSQNVTLPVPQCEVTPFLFPFLRQHLGTCPHTAPLHCSSKHRKTPCSPESPSESDSRASHGSRQSQVPFPNTVSPHNPSSAQSQTFLSPIPSFDFHFLFPSLASSLLLRVSCTDRGLGSSCQSCCPKPLQLLLHPPSNSQSFLTLLSVP